MLIGDDIVKVIGGIIIIYGVAIVGSALWIKWFLSGSMRKRQSIDLSQVRLFPI